VGGKERNASNNIVPLIKPRAKNKEVIIKIVSVKGEHIWKLSQ